MRPTCARAREALFSTLAVRAPSGVAGASILDLFAGTGALGLEALSRGADFCLFVDTCRTACRIIRKNRDACRVGESAAIRRCDVRRLGSRERVYAAPFDVAFIDPPYGYGLAEIALDAADRGGWLSSHAVVAVEEDRRSAFRVPEAFAEIAARRYGDTIIRIVMRRTAPRAVTLKTRPPDDGTRPSP